VESSHYNSKSYPQIQTNGDIVVVAAPPEAESGSASSDPSAPAICNDVPEMPDRDQGPFPTTLQTPRRGLFPLPSSLRSVIHDLLFFLSFSSALFPNSPSSLETAKGNEARASKRSAAKPSLTPPHRRPTSETGGKKQAAACLPAKKGQSDREEGKGKREAGIGLEDGARRRLSPI